MKYFQQQENLLNEKQSIYCDLN